MSQRLRGLFERIENVLITVIFNRNTSVYLVIGFCSKMDEYDHLTLNLWNNLIYSPSLLMWFHSTVTICFHVLCFNEEILIQLLRYRDRIVFPSLFMVYISKSYLLWKSCGEKVIGSLSDSNFVYSWYSIWNLKYIEMY